MSRNPVMVELRSLTSSKAVIHETACTGNNRRLIKCITFQWRTYSILKVHDGGGGLITQIGFFLQKSVKKG